MGKNQHVVKTIKGWALRGENNSKMTKYYDTQKEAIEDAKKIAINQRSEVLIHGTDGKIREKHSYGNDDFPPIG